MCYQREVLLPLACSILWFLSKEASQGLPHKAGIRCFNFEQSSLLITILLSIFTVLHALLSPPRKVSEQFLIVSDGQSNCVNLQPVSNVNSFRLLKFPKMFPYSDWPIQIEANDKHVKKLSNFNKKNFLKWQWYMYMAHSQN